MSFSSPVPLQLSDFRKLLNLDYEVIEKEVEDLPGLYKNLDPRALYTSLEDFYGIMKSPFVSGTWVDLGGGIGESAFLYSWLFPERSSVSIEFSHSRAKAGQEILNRLNLPNVKIIEGDLLDCEIPDGETYFLYFPTGQVLDRILFEIRNKKNFKRLIAIESHGDLFARLEKENWLKLKSTIHLTSPRHNPEAWVMERMDAPDEFGPHQLSFRYKLLLIEDKWLGETWGLEWLREDQYQLLHPPRTIQWKDIKVLNFHELKRPAQILISLRRLGELQITSGSKQFKASIRKIIENPSFEVELSSGEWVKWDEISTICLDNKLCYESSSDYFFSPPVPWEK